MSTAVLSVSQLNRYVRARLDEDPRLQSLFVQGEICNYSGRHASGHLYFGLKDSASTVRAVMFRGNAQHLRFEPENGLRVVVRCTASLFERDGAYQLYVQDMIPDGMGQLALAFEQRKAKLAAEGLFDPQHKKALPAMPGTIGVITSGSGAALQDILNILQRRYPVAQVLLCPVLVQGEQAAGQLADAVRRLDADGRADVIIIGRGGGSAEDLWPFNDEDLVRAIHACRIPVVSAVGHEVDHTLCDLAADLRAPTPSAAAELVAPDRRDICERLSLTGQRMGASMQRQLRTADQKLQGAQALLAFRSPQAILTRQAVRLQTVRGEMEETMRRRLIQSERSLAQRAQMLEALSPLRVLARGYAVVMHGDTAVSSVAQLHPGDQVQLRFGDGSVQATIDGA